jgi:hypothetical protein
MSEPCKHERVVSDEIKSFVGTIQALVKVQAERDAALAKVSAVRALLLIADHPVRCAVWGQDMVYGGGPGPCDCVLEDIELALEARP